MRFRLATKLAQLTRALNRKYSRTLRHASAKGLRAAAKAAELGSKPLAKAAEVLTPNVLPGFTRFIQGDSFTCGVESVRMVLAYYGQRIGTARARTLLQPDEDNGINEVAITRLLRRRGLRVRVLGRPARVELMAAIDRGEPVIVLLEGNDHWGVVYGYGAGLISLADPSFRRAPLPLTSWKRFKARWTTGYGLAVGVRR